MKQYFQKNWLILSLVLALILVFVFGGMYFRHVIYTGQSLFNLNIGFHDWRLLI